MKPVDELVVRYLDGSISDEDLALLGQQIETDAAARECLLDCSLIAAIAGGAEKPEPRQLLDRLGPWRHLALASFAGAFVLIFGLAFWAIRDWNRAPVVAGPPPAAIEPWPELPTAVENDDTVWRARPLSNGVIAEFGPMTQMRTGTNPDGDFHAKLEAGSVILDAPAETKATLRTIDTEIEFQGSALAVYSDGFQTKITVLRGPVFLTKFDGEQRFKVQTGYSTEEPSVPTNWELNPETLNPERILGQISQSGGTLVIRAVRHFIPPDRNVFAIVTERDRLAGEFAMFAANPDDALELRLRMSRPADLNILIRSRGVNFESAANEEYTLGSSEIVPDEWRTIQVPLNEIDPQLQDEARFYISFSLESNDVDTGLEVHWVRLVQGE